jgi:hypothetical protein
VTRNVRNPSHGYFGFVVETLGDTAGELLCRLKVAQRIESLKKIARMRLTYRELLRISGAIKRCAPGFWRVAAECGQTRSGAPTHCGPADHRWRPRALAQRRSTPEIQ